MNDDLKAASEKPADAKVLQKSVNYLENCQEFDSKMFFRVFLDG